MKMFQITKSVKPCVYDGKKNIPNSHVEFRHFFPNGVICKCNARHTIFRTHSAFKNHRNTKTHKRWMSLIEHEEEDFSDLLENSRRDIKLLKVKNTELSNEVSQLTLKLQKYTLENKVLKKLWIELRSSDAKYDLD